MGKFPGGTLYFSEVYRALVYAGGEVGRAGIGEYLGHGQPLFVFRQVAGSGEAAVQVDVLGMTGVAGLDEFWVMTRRPRCISSRAYQAVQ